MMGGRRRRWDGGRSKDEVLHRFIEAVVGAPSANGELQRVLLYWDVIFA